MQRLHIVSFQLQRYHHLLLLLFSHAAFQHPAAAFVVEAQERQPCCPRACPVSRAGDSAEDAPAAVAAALEANVREGELHTAAALASRGLQRQPAHWRKKVVAMQLSQSLLNSLLTLTLYMGTCLTVPLLVCSEMPIAVAPRSWHYLLYVYRLNSVWDSVAWFYLHADDLL